ncbi:NAD-dependent deacetylase [Allocatelliglobosispora scoriae]|uniref:protein acetyllysine N-acetyltransferase n=1 Tax=Allocatelliglobosispora scoriae TaxID=643052 RepID=A0A841BNA6_9ACTN|nr:Sir2 family NAD-dependent protein deacetylase [Allocatelliglobosispora scoriae]MBB5869155.1 NAD-dependent deacetylase [Allocatelliglobosispora scoriae]
MNERKPMIAVLTGAGISTDSGIPDFRGPQGVWTRDPEMEKLFTLDNYLADTTVRARSWLARRDNPVWRATPNPAHLALAELERSGLPVRIITQNIDGLHQKSGISPRKVIELHGTMFTVRCLSCDDRTTMEQALARVEQGEPDPACLLCGGILKSGTVMFGENLDPEVLNQAGRIAEACDVFWAVGTSLRVEPAASLCLIAANAGARLVIVNADPTPYDGIADELVREPIGVALPTMVAALRDSIGMA